MALPVRIFSDVHLGDRSSGVRSLEQIRPLCTGIAALVLNGDTFDTRPGPNPVLTDHLRGETARFFGALGIPVTLVTGNHDADLIGPHVCDLAEGRVFLTHGDVLFPNVVPWSRDAAPIRRLLRAGAGAVEPEALPLPERLALWRRVTAVIPQRHQSEPHPVKYAVRFAADTIWPPWRFYHIFDAWRTLPGRAEALVRRDRPGARFILLGHTHRPGVWTLPSGLVVVNTGSFSRPFGGFAVDLLPERLLVRRIEAAGGEYRPGRVLREFALDPSARR